MSVATGATNDEKRNPAMLKGAKHLVVCEPIVVSLTTRFFIYGLSMADPDS